MSGVHSNRPAARMLRLDPRDDRGSILPLVAGFGTLALAVVLLVSAATSLYLERTRLYTLADGAALAAAESFDLASVRPTAEGTLRPRPTTSSRRRVRGSSSCGSSPRRRPTA